MRSHAKHAKASSAIAAVGCAIFLACLLASPALAAKGVVGFLGIDGEGIEGGQFSSSFEGPGGLAVNQNGNGGAAAGDVYVVDRGNNRIQQFHSNGTWVRAFGLDVGGAGVEVCEAAASCAAGTESGEASGMSAPQGIAIEQSTGNLYVTDQGNRRIDVFSATGSFEGAFGWNVKVSGGAEELQLCTEATGCQAGSEGADAGQFSFALGYPALSPLNGHLLVANKAERRVDEFQPTLVGGLITGVSFVRGYGWGAVDGGEAFQICTTSCHAPGATGAFAGQFGESAPTSLAVGSTGRVLALDSENHRVQAFSPAATPEGLFAQGPLSGFQNSPAALTVDLANDHVLAAVSGQVRELTSSGSVLQSFPEGGELFARGIASASGGGKVYLSSPFGPDSKPGVFVLDSAPPLPPGASIEAVTTFTATTATFSGHVNPQGWQTGWHFEYSRDGVNWERAPAEDEQISGDNAEHAVSAEVTGLSGSTHYQVRLVGTKQFKAGTATAETTFNTPTSAPVISETAASHLTDTEAKLEARLNPEGQATEYQFEYVDQASFEAEGFAAATKAPVSSTTLPGGEATIVAAQLTGLESATAYRFRLVATNPTGTTEGEEASFDTYPPEASFAACPNDSLRSGAGAGLPDCRAYEQASPVAKDGVSVFGKPSRVQAAPDGHAVTFYTDVPIPGGAAQQYVATRNGNNWLTRGMGSAGMGWTEDLSAFFNWELDLLRGTGLETQLIRSSDGGLETIVSRGAGGVSEYVGTSSGAAEVAFENTRSLTPGAPANVSNVYLWDRASGQLRLASVLPDSACATPPCPALAGAFAGPYGWQQGRPEQGGAEQGYRTQEEHAFSEDGSRLYFTTSGDDQLYLREGLDGPTPSTVQVSASHTAPDPNGHKPAIFIAATPFGSRAFFTSCEKLTVDSTAVSTAAGVCDSGSEEGRDLYAFDARSGELHDLTIDGTDPLGAQVQGVIGASDDGSYVYFVANGVLAANANPEGETAQVGDCAGLLLGEPQSSGICNLYVWHDGATSFIARISGVANGTTAEGDGYDWLASNVAGGFGQISTGTGPMGRVSADGTAVLFRSTRQLSAYDNEDTPEFYRYSASEGTLDCVSCNPTGEPPRYEPTLNGIHTLNSNPTAAIATRNLSSDGERVFFETAEKLIARDTNGDEGCPQVSIQFQPYRACQDVYEWEAEGVGSCNSALADGGCLYLLSSGKSPDPSFFADASSAGDDAFVFTGQPLVRQDGDELIDVYDARVEGGLAAQSEVPPVPCEGEACKGGAGGQPQSASPPTASFSGPGNPKPRHRKHGHRRHRKHGHHRHARHGKGRAGK